jgi:hypothetical protein
MDYNFDHQMSLGKRIFCVPTNAHFFPIISLD